MPRKNNFQILIVWAFPKELQNLKNFFKNSKPEKIQADFLYTGMGNYKTILSLSQCLQQKKYDFLLQIGICGKKQETAEKIIQIAKIKNIANNKELCVPIFEEIFPLESIACSEKIIYHCEEIWEENFVDMESYGFEFCAQEYKIPRLILKIPYDRIGAETKNFSVKNLETYLENIFDFPYLFWKIQNFLEKKWQESSPNLDIFSFHLTQSEIHIFQYEVQKYETLSWKSFQDFYKKYGNIPKKDFLKHLKEENKNLSKI